MAWSYLTNASSYNGKVFGWKEIVCDEDSDIAKLPTRGDAIAIGSVARVLNGNKTYVLSNTRVWTLVDSKGGNGELPEVTEADAYKVLGVDAAGKYALIDAEYGYGLAPVHASSGGAPIVYRSAVVDLVNGESYTFIFTIDGVDGDFILTSTAQPGKDNELVWSAESGVYTFSVISHYPDDQYTGLATQIISVVTTATGERINSAWTFDYNPGIHKIPAEYLDVEGGGNGDFFIIPCTISWDTNEGYALTLSEEVGYDEISAAFKDGKRFAIQVNEICEIDAHAFTFAAATGGVDLFSHTERFFIKAVLDDNDMTGECARWYISITAETDAITAVVQPECSFALQKVFGSNDIAVTTRPDETIDGKGMFKLFNDGANIVMTADSNITNTLGVYGNMKILSAYVDDDGDPQIYYFVTQAFYTGSAFAICRIKYEVRNSTWSYDIIGG